MPETGNNKNHTREKEWWEVGAFSKISSRKSSRILLGPTSMFLNKSVCAPSRRTGDRGVESRGMLATKPLCNLLN
jgi:hypothetical protein